MRKPTAQSTKTAKDVTPKGSQKAPAKGVAKATDKTKAVPKSAKTATPGCKK
jgi:hypothetical protein